MGKHERRKSMPLDEAYFYLRRLELGLERPALFKVCNAIKTIDLALEADAAAPGTRHISRQAWSAVRKSMFRTLMTCFPGYFHVYGEFECSPLDAGSAWPENGFVEFYPEKILRRFETYKARFEELDADLITCLRWCWGQERQDINPGMFKSVGQAVQESEAAPTEEEAVAFLDKLYEICEEEAAEGKKFAHRKWCQLYWEANSCPDRRQRHELQKQMLSLQSVWGRPAQIV